MEKENGAWGRIRNAGRTVLAAAVWFLLADASMTVKAAPVSLESQSAAVYEQTNEESSIIGNLIQGGTFDYQGDVTAEDGSVWHMVTTAGGAAGYIRGDIVFSAVEAAGGENGAAAADTAGAGNEAAAADTAGAGNAAAQMEAAGTGNTEAANGNTAEPEADEAAEGDEAAGEEDALAGNTANIVSGVENNREKTYAIGSEGAKIKTRESQTEGEAAAETSAKAGFFSRLDKTLLFSGLVLICAAAAGIFSFDRMKKEHDQLDESWNEMPEETAYRHDRKYEKRKRKNRRRKSKKKKQTGRN